MQDHKVDAVGHAGNIYGQWAVVGRKCLCIYLSSQWAKNLNMREVCSFSKVKNNGEYTTGGVGKDVHPTL